MTLSYLPLDFPFIMVQYQRSPQLSVERVCFGLFRGREHARINDYLKSFVVVVVVPVLSISFFWEPEVLFQACINPLEATFVVRQESLSPVHLFLNRWKPV